MITIIIITVRNLETLHTNLLSANDLKVDVSYVNMYLTDMSDFKPMNLPACDQLTRAQEPALTNI